LRHRSSAFQLVSLLACCEPRVQLSAISGQQEQKADRSKPTACEEV
jgi:hypothetical protein